MSLACPSVVTDISPDLCRAVQNYCERTSTALDAEPVNSVTNAAFLVAAWVAWRLQLRHPELGAAGLVRALIYCTALVGFGSFLFHTIATRWAEWGDVLPILAFMLLFLWASLTCFFGWRPWTKLGALTLFFGSTFTLEAVIPSEFLHGGALYAPALLTLIAIDAALSRRQPTAGRAMFGATGVFLVSITARTLDMPVCQTFPLGTHFLWHILNAVLFYLLIRAVILHGSRPAQVYASG
jgi:hypothetical protein